MKAEGLTKESVGREGFLERAFAWKEKYGGRIIEQLKSLGSSCDWSRLAFTMDEKCSKAVKEVFVKLYEKGLIYRGSRIINWCPSCRTAISDAEVEFAEEDGFFWHIRYDAVDGGEGVVIATTRPETLLGDTAVAVNPKDKRYAHLVGKKLILPLVGREIPVVADSYVDMEFGTGVVKITPAHDPNDFEVGLRHNLEVIRVMDDGGVINEKGGKYVGMERYEARKAIVEDLEALGQLVKIEPHKHNVGHCYRCHTVIEPIVSKQWFVKMEPLAKPAIKCVKDKSVKFLPKRFEKIYFNWMENIKDWSSAVSSGGGIGSPRTIVRTAERPSWRQSSPKSAPSADAAASTRTRMCSIPGFPRRCGPFRRWAIPTRRPISTISIRRMCSSPPTISSSSGWRA